MGRALQTSLPPDVMARLRGGGGGGAAAVDESPAPAKPAGPVVADEPEDVDEPEVRVARRVPARPVQRSVKPKQPDPLDEPRRGAHTRSVQADLGELDLGERIRQVTTRMPITLADRLDIAVLRQKRTGGGYRSFQAIMIAGAERVLEELEGAA